MKRLARERAAWADERRHLVGVIESLCSGIKTATDFMSTRRCPKCDGLTQAGRRELSSPSTGERRG